MPWVYDSVEKLIQRNSLLPSKLFGFDPSGTAYDRFEVLNRSNGLVGFAWTGLRQAYYGPDADRLLLVKFETLTANPSRALEAIYDFLDIPPFKHDFNDVDFNVDEFDKYLGTPGLHSVGRQVKAETRAPVLPPDLFNRVANDSFWKDPVQNTRRVKIV
jgi:sulfotransferase